MTTYQNIHINIQHEEDDEGENDDTDDEQDEGLSLEQADSMAQNYTHAVAKQKISDMSRCKRAGRAKNNLMVWSKHNPLFFGTKGLTMSMNNGKVMYHGNNVVGPSSDLKDVKENPRFSIMFSSLRLKHGGQKEKEADISR
ncbi:uncharacterized protein ARB_00633 [Trichophyton benhamiae CBS 112371]|uniref:Uncharacterized protein n=1 Tax=Arthroderma benhamiae (strain ATCC MYA-4681 / CBS 112371) TaxID=663331 RepID=D4AWR7_ARTBC|nr:uncharacterized protein ARB_00633 [Trichophyton benhamiae CBS 112371]EFE32448.1 hypothetical protein ARB_00633 [Trichophyton benhamiae CBS 112371]